MLCVRQQCGWTPLFFAASTADVENGFDTVPMLLRAGSCAGVRDNEGWSPLHYAARQGRADVCSALLRATPLNTELLQSEVRHMLAVVHACCGGVWNVFANGWVDVRTVGVAVWHTTCGVIPCTRCNSVSTPPCGIVDCVRVLSPGGVATKARIASSCSPSLCSSTPDGHKCTPQSSCARHQCCVAQRVCQRQWLTGKLATTSFS